MLLAYEILFGLLHVNGSAFSTLRIRCGVIKYATVKQRSVDRIRQSFFSVTEWLIYGTIYQLVQVSQVLANLVDLLISIIR